MKRLDWNWLCWQVGLPLIGPLALSAIFALLWWSLQETFLPQIKVLVDVTPWALATYSLTLIGSALRLFWARSAQHPWLSAGLVAVALADTIYYAFMVIRRHDPTFVVASPAYFVSGILVMASITLCYRAR